jgi:anti-anti-sigma factor
MSLQPKVEHDGNVTTITFTNGKVRREGNTIAAELDGLTEDLDGRHLILDCRALVRIHSEELGTLIGLHKRVCASGGRLSLTNVTPEVYEVFEVSRLTTYLTVQPAEAPEADGPSTSSR